MRGRNQKRFPKLIFFSLTFLLVNVSLHAADQRFSLAGMFSEEFLARNLVPPDSFKPYPDIEERAFWEDVPDTLRIKLIREADSYLGKPWLQMTATEYLGFERVGNSYEFEHKYYERRRRLSWLVVAECMEADGRFLDEIVNGIWLICEESSWTMPGHMRDQKAGAGLPDPDEQLVAIFGAETGTLLAWTYYLLGDRLDTVSPMVRKRIKYEVERRILVPSLERDDYWWQSFHTEYINNWNPWTNTSWLTMLFILEEDRGRLVASVHKSLMSLDRFISHYPADGGCDEGPLYWGKSPGSLFDCLELLYWATDGKIDLFSNDFIKRMGSFICKVHIADEYFVNFADSPAKVNIWANLVYRYGKRIGDREMQNLGAMFSQRGIGKDYLEVGSLGRILPALCQFREINAYPVVAESTNDVWLDQIQLMAARSNSGSGQEMFVAAKGGFNEENHNHNDVGQFIVYVYGKPAIVDLGVGQYTKDTFNENRYTIWTMQSAWHNLPTVNGFMQAAGGQYRSSDVTCDFSADNVRFSQDIAGAYPAEAGVKSWQRTLEFNRENSLSLREEFSLSYREGEIAISLVTPCEVTLDAESGFSLSADKNGEDSSLLTVIHEEGKFSTVVDTVNIEDAKLRKAWGETIYRIRLILKNNAARENSWLIEFKVPD